MLKSFPSIKIFPIPAAYFVWSLVSQVWEQHGVWLQKYGRYPLCGESVQLFAGVVWLALVITYITKWILYRPAVLAEVNDPIQCCYISLFPATTIC